MNISVIKKGKEAQKPFPKLMISSLGQIILAHGISEDGLLMGILLKSNGYEIASHYSKNWHTPMFEDFEGSVILSNE